MNADNQQVQYATGAVRSADAEATRYDLVSHVGMRRLAETCAEGAAKYGDRNWEKGMPVTVMLNHGLRHIFMYLAGDASEDHLAHAAWNLFGAMHMEELRPDLMDIPTRQPSGNNLAKYRDMTPYLQEQGRQSEAT